MYLFCAPLSVICFSLLAIALPLLLTAVVALLVGTLDAAATVAAAQSM